MTFVSVAMIVEPIIHVYIYKTCPWDSSDEPLTIIHRVDPIRSARRAWNKTSWPHILQCVARVDHPHDCWCHYYYGILNCCQGIFVRMIEAYVSYRCMTYTILPRLYVQYITCYICAYHQELYRLSTALLLRVANLYSYIVSVVSTFTTVRVYIVSLSCAHTRIMNIWILKVFMNTSNSRELWKTNAHNTKLRPIPSSSTWVSICQSTVHSPQSWYHCQFSTTSAATVIKYW